MADLTVASTVAGDTRASSVWATSDDLLPVAHHSLELAVVSQALHRSPQDPLLLSGRHRLNALSLGFALLKAVLVADEDRGDQEPGDHGQVEEIVVH